MATVAADTPVEPIPVATDARFAQFVDRWIFTFVAGLFVVTALTGFVPSSLNKIAAVQAGLRPPFPAILHVHAVLMGSWLLLLLTQAILQATGRKSLHRTLGTAGFVVAPAMVLAGLVLVPATREELWNALQAAPPGPQRAVLEANFERGINILLVQLRIAIVFTTMITWGLLSRRSDPGRHKRLMFLGTVILLSAAITRIHFLPTTFPASYAAVDLYLLLLVSPMFAWDLYRLRTVHPAYVIWLGVLALPTLAVHSLWGNAWWQAIGPRVLGLS
jgi:hypothetical protein